MHSGEAETKITLTAPASLAIWTICRDVANLKSVLACGLDDVLLTSTDDTVIHYNQVLAAEF